MSGPSDLFGGAPRNVARDGLDFSATIVRLKNALTFGDVASGLGLSGASRHGWDCPRCGGERTVRERPDHRGARCKACDKGYDVLGLVMEAEDLGARAGARRLQAILDKRDAAGSAPGDLFDASGGKT